MFYSIFHHRKSKGAKPASFHESTTVEIIWTVIPFVILVGMAIPATKTLIMMEDTRNSEITLKVTGYQWMWKYDYVEDDVSFFSKLASDSNEARQLGSKKDVKKVDNYLLSVDNEVVLPTDTKVRILLTASDVIHAWWVPEITGKKDAIPGYINELWVDIKKPGVYRGQCTELCGKDHGFMPIVVRAVPKQEYTKWVSLNQKNRVADKSK
jgi:cytochrome c oxidase subunit 2